MGWMVAVLALAGFIGLAWLFVTIAPDLARDVAPSIGGRYAALDGFRGLLAIAVLLHHGSLLRHVARGETAAALTPLELMFGRGAVAFFFMASAALFVDQIVHHQGRLSLRRFYGGRLRRLVPLYVSAVIAALVIVLVEGGGIAESPALLTMNAGRWLLFDFVARPDLNGIAGSADYLGSAWSLRYEWMLYLALPVLAFAYRKVGHAGVLFVGLALIALYIHLFALFLAGAVAGTIGRKGRWRHAEPALGVLALLGIAAALRWVPEFASARAAPFLFPAFLLVWRGRSPLVGWLGALPMRYLGQISYGIYLLHGFVLAGVSKSIPVTAIAITDSAIGFVTVMTVAFCAAMLLATATYLMIERPFVRGEMPVRTHAWRRRLAARRLMPRSTGTDASIAAQPGSPAVAGA